MGRKREEIDVLATHYCNQAGSGTVRRARTPRAVLAPVTRIVVPGEKAQKRGQRYGCLGISPSEELCIGKWLRTSSRGLDLIYSQRTYLNPETKTYSRWWIVLRVTFLLLLLLWECCWYKEFYCLCFWAGDILDISISDRQEIRIVKTRSATRLMFILFLALWLFPFLLSLVFTFLLKHILCCLVSQWTRVFAESFGLLYKNCCVYFQDKQDQIETLARGLGPGAGPGGWARGLGPGAGPGGWAQGSPNLKSYDYKLLLGERA